MILQDLTWGLRHFVVQVRRAIPYGSGPKQHTVQDLSRFPGNCTSKYGRLVCFKSGLATSAEQLSRTMGPSATRPACVAVGASTGGADTVGLSQRVSLQPARENVWVLS